MPRRIAQNVSLTPQHAAFIAAQVAAGRYAGVSAVVRAALDGLAMRQTPPATERPAQVGPEQV